MVRSTDLHCKGLHIYLTIEKCPSLVEIKLGVSKHFFWRILFERETSSHYILSTCSRYQAITYCQPAVDIDPVGMKGED